MPKQVNGVWLPDREDDVSEVEKWARHPVHVDYEISSEGRVRRITAARATHIGKVLRPGIGSHGYKSVVLDGKARLVHRLVLEAFVGPQPAGREALHADDEKLNCRLSNLSWGTRAANMYDRAKNGAGRYGSRSTQAKLSEHDVERIRRERALGTSSVTLGKEYGVSSSLIRRIARNECWRHVQ